MKEWKGAIIVVSIVVGLVGIGFLIPAPRRAEPQDLTPEQRASMQAASRAKTLAEAAAQFPANKTALESEMAFVGQLVESKDWINAEARLLPLQSQVDLLLDGPIGQSPDVRRLSEQLDRHVNAVLAYRETFKAFDLAEAREDIEVRTVTWSKGGFDQVGLWTVQLRNTSKVAEYSDIEYRTTYSAPSGTVVTRNAGQILDRLRPGQTKRFEVNDGFIHDQASTASFSIVNATKARPTAR